MIMWPWTTKQIQSAEYNELSNKIARLETRMEQLETRMNSLRGLVNRKLGFQEVGDPESGKEEPRKGLVPVPMGKGPTFKVK